MANRISYFRKKAGLSQVALAEALHSGRSTVTKLERSEIPLTDRWLERLAAILDCTPADLFGKDTNTIGELLSNLFDSGEFETSATTRKFRVVRLEGGRQVSREIEHYNLDVILTVGYRVNGDSVDWIELP